MPSPRLVPASTFARAVELAAAALAGLESIVLSARHGLPVRLETIEGFMTAIAQAREELIELELKAVGHAGDDVHVH